MDGGSKSAEDVFEDDEMNFELIEKQWLEAIGEEEDIDEFVDAECMVNDDETGTGSEDEFSDDDEVLAAIEEELYELMEDNRIEATLEDFVENGSELFSVAKVYFRGPVADASSSLDDAGERGFKPPSLRLHAQGSYLFEDRFVKNPCGYRCSDTQCGT